MDLLTLNLHSALSWNSSEGGGIRSIDAAIATAMASADGAEVFMSWPWNDMVDESGDDGPHARRPLSPPVTVAAKGLSASDGTGNADEQLPPGRYLFVQLRPGGAEEIADAVDSFAREAWWSRAVATGPLIVRLVREDGKTAAQIIRKLAAATDSR